MAALSTFMAVSGIDATANALAGMQPAPASIAWSAFPLLLGIVAPAVVPLAIAWKYGPHAAATCGGVLLATVALVLLGKLTTSRVSPEALYPATIFERSISVRLGLFSAGPIESLIEGWPSGHAANNTAVAVIVYRLSTRPLIRQCAVIWIAWVFLATAFGIAGDVHWLSDSISGLAIGLVTSLVSNQSPVTAKSNPKTH